MDSAGNMHPCLFGCRFRSLPVWRQAKRGNHLPPEKTERSELGIAADSCGVRNEESGAVLSEKKLPQVSAKLQKSQTSRAFGAG